MSSDSNPAVANLQTYLRIRSVQPNANYDECIQYLKGQAKELGLPVQVFELLSKKPVLVMTWEGLQPTLPTILLNSHMDVVPVYEESWSHPPFAAEIVDGVIYARGAQEMKSVGIQYIEAVRRLKASGSRFKRTIHLSFVPDEELGGRTGMVDFVKTQDFTNLNVGFSLDEGNASPNDSYLVFNSERTIYHVDVKCAGMSGHGSVLLPDNNGEKLRYILDKFMDLRQQAKQKLADDPTLTLADVTSVNLTMLSGGIQDNVVPEMLTASFDVRLAASLSPSAFETMLNQWCTEAGKNVTVVYSKKDPYVPPTPTDDSNIYWKAFKEAADKMNIKLILRAFPGATDSRYIREKGIPALCFSAMSNTVLCLHEHDERLPVDAFLRGIAVYEGIIPAVANA